MRNLEIALCDIDDSYIMRFASYLMEKCEAGIHIFTSTEGFFEDEGTYDLAIMSEDFKELCDFKTKGMVRKKYFLSENVDEESEDCIYKYQSVEGILEKLNLLKYESVKKSINNSNNESKLIGVYSPISHELQLPFTMALNQEYTKLGRVLFLDLQEISILPAFAGSCERNLLDLLYEINTSTEKVDLSSYVKSYMDFDYISPFYNPNEIGEIDEATWISLFDWVLKLKYDHVIVLFGRVINGFKTIMERFEKLYVLSQPGDYYKNSRDQFLDYLKRLNLPLEIENVNLKMTAKNLSEGTYELKELLQGNLGMFVEKLMSMNGQNEYYG